MTATDPSTAPRPPGAAIDEHPRRLTPFQRSVIAVVEHIPTGEVMTYVEVAAEAGHPGAAQAVANVLRRVDGLHWWRVIPADGRLYCSHEPTQRPLLEADGVAVDADRHVRP